VLIPIGTDRPLARPTVVNHGLVAINIAVYMAMWTLHRGQPEAFDELQSTLWLEPAHIRPWSLITYAFLHGGLWHLLGNMAFLWVFGPNVEDRLGRVGYLIFYLVAAAASGGLHAFAENAPVVGASGAIAAVTGVYLVLFPRTNIRTLIVFFAIGVYEIPAWWFIGGQVALNLLMEASDRSGNIATLAHLGGYAFGGILAMLLLATGLLKREMYDLFTISKHAARRRQFRELEYQRRKAAREGRHPATAFKTTTADPATVEAVALARAQVAEKLEASDAQGAITAYRGLLEKHRSVPGATLLPRRTQYDIANALFAAGEHSTAAAAYEQWLEGYPQDGEAPVVRLMLGLICARYLNDPLKAKKEISTALPDLQDSHRALGEELLAELG
jgi:membrane associated rhomboid family serine protease